TKTKLSRQISLPGKESEQKEHVDVPPAQLTVQGLSHGRKSSQNTTRSMNRASLKNELPTAPAEPTPDVDYMRYLANLSTVTINHGREFRNVPAYLRQFEMSRRGSTFTGDRPTVRRRVSTVHEPVDHHPPAPTKPPNKVKRACVAVLSKHRAVGLRHFLFAIVLAAYAVGGMFLFHALEAPFEQKTVVETREAMNEAIDILAEDFIVASKVSNANMSMLLKKAYITLIKIDGKYTGSTFYKLEEREYPLWTWTYGTAFFFAFTLYSTVGYGSIFPSTDLGRVVVIFYTAIGFPVALVIVRDIGSVLLVYLTRIYAFIVTQIRKVRGYNTQSSEEAIMLPMNVAFLLSFFVVLMTAVFVANYDAGGPEPGLGLFHSFYFCFLSYAAVGLGDLMPVNHVHPPLVAIVLLCCMPLMRVINRVLYVGIENRMYGTVACLEDSIDRIAPDGNEQEDRLETIAEDVENDPHGFDHLSTLDEDLSGGEEDQEDNRIHQELMNNFTLRSASGISNHNKEQQTK
ncbi:hypothetical protein PMAYCL1PPCAC_17227, partial [Pristionchus mayeri]